MMKCWFTFLVIGTLLLSDVRLLQAQAVINPLISSKLSTLTAEQILKLDNPQNGYTVLNTTTGCINYFFNGLWYEYCGNCLPKLSKPQFQSVRVATDFVQVRMRDTAHYKAVLLPDSSVTYFTGNMGTIAKPARYYDTLLYRLLVFNLNDPCEHRPAADTTVQFRKRTNTRMPLPFETLQTGARRWTVKPSDATSNDRKVCVTINRFTYYNWSALNTDPYNPKHKPLHTQEKVCPSPFRLPTVQDAEELRENWDGEKHFAYFKSGDAGTVATVSPLRTESTDERHVYMLQNTDHPDGYQVMVITKEEVRVASLPRQVYAKVLCVMDE
ncbi:MAG: hypothetical protein NZM35_04675 [Chitinophagales bacterium]|nr:hypothetical protein [Chitinophagales bacterium]MDW8420040.1 hypothetical protein [Chitinophagales bacterium]